MKKEDNIKNVYETTYDGWIICTHKKDDELEAYEGRALCPLPIQLWLERNEPVQIDGFHEDAIAYGYCE